MGIQLQQVSNLQRKIGLVLELCGKILRGVCYLQGFGRVVLFVEPMQLRLEVPIRAVLVSQQSKVEGFSLCIQQVEVYEN